MFGWVLNTPVFVTFSCKNFINPLMHNVPKWSDTLSFVFGKYFRVTDLVTKQKLNTEKFLKIVPEFFLVKKVLVKRNFLNFSRI